MKLCKDPLSRFNALGAKGAALALSGRPREGYELLREVRRDIVDGGFLGLLSGIELPLGAAMALSGQMAAGVKWMEDAIERFSGWGCDRLAAFGHAILGEMYAKMAIGAERPPLNVLLKNLWFVMLTLPFAASKARYHCNEAIRIGRESGAPGWAAQAQLNLALIEIRKKRINRARDLLEEAKETMQPCDWPVLEKKIDAELARLPNS